LMSVLLAAGYIRSIGRFLPR